MTTRREQFADVSVNDLKTWICTDYELHPANIANEVRYVSEFKDLISAKMGPKNADLWVKLHDVQNGNGSSRKWKAIKESIETLQVTLLNRSMIEKILSNPDPDDQLLKEAFEQSNKKLKQIRSAMDEKVQDAINARNVPNDDLERSHKQKCSLL